MKGPGVILPALMRADAVLVTCTCAKETGQIWRCYRLANLQLLVSPHSTLTLPAELYRQVVGLVGFAELESPGGRVTWHKGGDDERADFLAAALA